MRISRRSFVTGSFGLATLPAAIRAQEDSAAILSQIPGLQTAYARRYAPATDLPHADVDVEVTEATPDYLLIMAMRFQNAMMLTGVMNTMLSPDIAGMIMQWHGDSDELTETSLPSLPDGNRLFFDADSHDEYASLLVVPVDDVAYLVVTSGASADVQPTANGIGEFLNAKEFSHSPVKVLAEGVAEGGPFDVFPGLGDLDVLGGLLPMFDYDLMVSESPIATPAS